MTYQRDSGGPHDAAWSPNSQSTLVHHLEGNQCLNIPCHRYGRSVCPTPTGHCRTGYSPAWYSTGKKNSTANLTFTIFLWHYVSCRGCSLNLEYVTHFLWQKYKPKKFPNIRVKLMGKHGSLKNAEKILLQKSVKKLSRKNSRTCEQKEVKITLLLPEWNDWVSVILFIRLLGTWLG